MRRKEKAPKRERHLIVINICISFQTFFGSDAKKTAIPSLAFFFQYVRVCVCVNSNWDESACYDGSNAFP